MFDRPKPTVGCSDNGRRRRTTEEDNGIWRIETNKELDEPIKHRNIINYVKAQRSSWFGHINRMSEVSIVMKIYKWKPFTSKTSRKAQVPMGN